MISRLDKRIELLRGFGASPETASELLAYGSDAFDHSWLEKIPRFPLEDEEFVDDWVSYARQAEQSGFLSLAEHLVQLKFPIQKGISETPDYIAATRKGVDPKSLSLASGIVLQHPELCTAIVHRSSAGRIPILQTASRADFVSLVQAFSRRNEPMEVPASMGACMIAGYNNWSRFHRLRREWMENNPGAAFSFSLFSDRKALYQDRFMILSDDWYSGVPPESMRLSDGEWRRLSLLIRREHESVHYWTRRVLGSMRNNVFDEIIADFCGVVSASGRFRADWMMRFFGVEDPFSYREGGRLQNYRGAPPLSDAAFALLQRLVRCSAANLETLFIRHQAMLAGASGGLLSLLSLTRFSLEELASEFAVDWICAELARSQDIIDRCVRTGGG